MIAFSCDKTVIIKTNAWIRPQTEWQLSREDEKHIKRHEHWIAQNRALNNLLNANE